jgi:microcystin-dependent protein
MSHPVKPVTRVNRLRALVEGAILLESPLEMSDAIAADLKTRIDGSRTIDVGGDVEVPGVLDGFYIVDCDAISSDLHIKVNSPPAGSVVRLLVIGAATDNEITLEALEEGGGVVIVPPPALSMSYIVVAWERENSQYVILDLSPASGAVPIGTVVDFAGLTAPAGWAFCYGQAVSRTTYAAAFAVLGTANGAGDGSTTFNLPDLRGRVVAGKDDMGGVSADRLTSELFDADATTFGRALGNQAHFLTTSEAPVLNDGSALGDSSEGNTNVVVAYASDAEVPFSVVQPTLILNKIIRLQ